MSLLDVQPHKVSRDLRGYCVMFYGDAKAGKTSVATKFPNHILLAFEKGYNAIPGAMGYPINSWAEFKKAMRTLKTKEAKEKFQTVIVDTADIAYEYAEEYVAKQEGYQRIKDIPHGAGYRVVEQEFDKYMRDIVKLGYGLVLISHSVDKVFKDENGVEFNQIVTTLDKRGQKITSRMADIMGYIRNIEGEDGEDPHVRMFMRGTPRFIAGSRFKHIVPSIEFNYENLVNAIGDAIDKIESEYGADGVSQEGEKEVNLYKVKESEETFEEAMSKVKGKIAELMEEDSNTWAPYIRKVMDEQLGGSGKMLQDVLPSQKDMLELLYLELQDLGE